MVIDPTKFDLTPEQKRQVAELAEQTGRPWQDVLDEVLRSYRARNGPCTDTTTGKSFYDAMLDDGAIGIVKDGLPSDLATNPKYMEGFGRRAIQHPHARREAV